MEAQTVLTFALTLLSCRVPLMASKYAANAPKGKLWWRCRDPNLMEVTPVQKVSRLVMSLSSQMMTLLSLQSVSQTLLIGKLLAQSHLLPSLLKAWIKLKLTCTSRPKNLTCRALNNSTTVRAWQTMQLMRSKLVQAHLAGTSRKITW